MGKPRKIDLVLQGENVNGDAMFLNPHIRKQWAQHFNGQKWIATFRLTSSLNEKQRMFAYIHGPLLDTCLVWLEKTGQYDHIDTVQLYYNFKQMFARYTRYNFLTKQEEMAYYDYSDNDVPMDLLNKFINDIITYMENLFPGDPDNSNNPGFRAPDSQAYRVQQKFGKGFKAIKGTKFNDTE